MNDPIALYPALAQVMPTLAELGPDAGPLNVPAGTVLFDEHAPCQGFPLVLSGEVRVSRHSGDGRSLELYRLGPVHTIYASANVVKTAPI